MNMETSKLTAEGIIGEAVRIGAKMSGGEFPIEIFPIRIQRIISSLHDCQGYPVDYVAAAILAAIGVGILVTSNTIANHQVFTSMTPSSSRSGAVSFISSQASSCLAESFHRMEAKPSLPFLSGRYDLPPKP